MEKPIVFISYAADELALADFVRDLLLRWTQHEVDAFVAKRDISSGANPLKVMMEEKLKCAKSIIPICSVKSKHSSWVWWESSAVWARGYKIHPLFTNISANNFGAPLTLVCQGKEYFIKKEFVDTLQMVCKDLEIGLTTAEFTSEEEAQFLMLQKRYSEPEVEVDHKSLKIARNFLSALNSTLHECYQRLFVTNPYSHMDHQWVLLNYKDFNTADKHALWPELIKLEVFYVNLEIFKRINNIFAKFEELNTKIRILRPEIHNLNSGSIEVYNYRDLINEIRSLYVFPKGDNISYEESPVGDFLIKEIKSIENALGKG